MNRLERVLYDHLKNNPKLKNRVRDTYQMVMAAVPVKKYEYRYPIHVRQGFYFGFHDKTPFSPDNTMLLAHKFSGEDNKLPGPEDQVEIGFFFGDQYLEYRPVTKTLAWNWTQGAMLQWVGLTGLFIFNDYENDKHLARIVNTDGKLINQIARPVGAVSPDGSKALSYNFARLRVGMPGYGYANGIDPDQDIMVPSRRGSGLHLVNLKTGEEVELFTVSDIAAIAPEDSMKNAFHYFTHCLFSPSGKRFVFFHRWVVNNNQRFTRMISADVNGTDLHIFPTHEMVSHFAWQNDSSILAYARTRDQGDQYYLFKDKSADYQFVGERWFKSDGHPHYSPDGKYILTDTYPDRFGRQHLMIYDYQKDELTKLAMLKQPLRYIKGTRCDFHPRWDRKGSVVCFDSAHTGLRSLCTMKLPDHY